LAWRFEVVGGGDLDAWRARAAALGLGGRVTFHGAGAAAPFYERADIFLLPSSYEPFGLVVTEAAAHGLTPVCSRQCGALELWPGRPEWLDLAADEPPARWTAALRRLLTSPVERAAVARQAQQAISARSWDEVAREYAALFRDVADGGGASV
jgi:glycosyltransferase involved in cell wall biosynthesis